MPVRVKRKLVGEWWAIGLALGMLAGCADAPSTSTTYRSPDSRAFAENAMSTGPMLVRIEGRPYASSEQRTGEVVLAALTQSMRWTTPRLTTDPAAAKIPSMIMVMTFNGNGVDANAQCRGESRSGEPAPQGAVQVTASFCGRGAPISNAIGHIDSSSGVDDPLFAELIRRVGDDLFPRSEEELLGTGIGIGGGTGGFGIGGGRSGYGIGIGTGGGIGIHF